MKHFTKDNLIFAIIMFLFFSKLVDIITTKSGELNFEQEIKLHDVRKQRDSINNVLIKRDSLIKGFKKKYYEIKNDYIIDTSSVDELGSFFANFADAQR